MQLPPDRSEDDLVHSVQGISGQVERFQGWHVMEHVGGERLEQVVTAREDKGDITGVVNRDISPIREVEKNAKWNVDCCGIKS